MVELPPELKLAKKQARAIFKALDPSLERESILSALGRLGTSTLKRKIRHRAASIFEAAPSLLPELCLILDEAVNCRNYYVHGGDSKFDYAINGNLVNFFCDTLEFVFAASDLIEAGWDIKAWEKSSSRFHPFSIYFEGYTRNLRALKTLVS